MKSPMGKLLATGLVVTALTLSTPMSTFSAAPEDKALIPTELPDINSPELAWWRTSMETKDQRLQWWRDARFGMFIHWGVYSGLSSEWNGKAYKGYAEHIQRMAKIPIPVYREKVAGAFNPTQFNADEWVRLAKAAGMRYLIITAKHHDGFAMYDSKVSDYTVVKATPWKHDPMRELKAACEKYGLKLGFYYSHAFDWGDANGPGNDWDYDNPGGDRNLHGGREWWKASPEFLPQVRKYVNEKSIPQIVELIKNYHPDILWFDTPHKLPPAENLRILKAVREAGPNVVVNGRLVRGYGDYASTTDRPAEFPPYEGDWEGIPTTNESYGYSKTDLSHKPPSHFIQLLAKASARGGNLLMNIGPMGDGRFDPKDVAILEGVAAWMQVNGESIHGTTRTPLPVQAWGESTRKNNTLYLHVFNWPADGRIVIGGLKGKVQRAYLLADAKRTALPVERVDALDVLVRAPATAPDAVDTVVVVETDGAPTADTARLLSPTQNNQLRAMDGTLNGRTLRFGDGKAQNAVVQNWSKTDESVSWSLRLQERTSFDITVTYDAEAPSAGGTYSVKIAGQTHTGRVAENRNKSLPLGRVSLEPGALELRIMPAQIKGDELMRLRSITLKPVKD